MTTSTDTASITPVNHLHGHWYFADLHTTDIDAAQRFYEQLFGWDVSDIPGAPNPYRPASIDGRSKAALTALVAEQLDAGVGSYWFGYLFVDDIDAATAKVVELGGRILHDTVNVFDMGRMAVAEDPTGAGFGIWQDAKPGETTVFDEHGSPFWYEAHSTDVDATKAFYSALVGWEWTTLDMGGGMTYATAAIPTDDDPRQQGTAGQMSQMQAQRERGVPSSWAVYFHVDDADAAYAKALELGATSVMEPHDIPDVGRSCWLMDPTGAVFAAMTPLPRD